MPRCPWCKELLHDSELEKHLEAHVEQFRVSHPDVLDACEHLSPKQAEEQIRKQFITPDPEC